MTRSAAAGQILHPNTYENLLYSSGSRRSVRLNDVLLPDIATIAVGRLSSSTDLRGHTPMRPSPRVCHKSRRALRYLVRVAAVCGAEYRIGQDVGGEWLRPSVLVRPERGTQISDPVSSSRQSSWWTRPAALDDDATW